MEDGARGGI